MDRTGCGAGKVEVSTSCEIDMFGESGKKMAGHCGKEMDGESRNLRGLIDALSRHCEILRRETAFLRMEAMFLRRSRKKEEKSAHRRIAHKGDMSDQESIGLANSYSSHDRQSIIRSQVSSITEKISEVPLIKEMESRKIKPASQLKSYYDEKELAKCFDFILHETEDLGNRMESVANILNEVGIPISLYKIEELVAIVFRLTQISGSILQGDTMAKMVIDDVDEDEEGEEVVVEEVGEKETEYTKSVLDMESYFALRRVGWESAWGSRMGRCGCFTDTTTLSPMHFTHCTPGRNPDTSVTGSTLQIYYIKIEVDATTNIFNWPLYVYGVVAARDTVDRNRNRLFCRSRDNCQKLSAADPFLRLTGPSRAIVSLDPVDFEIELKIKDGTNGIPKRDRMLICSSYHYTCCGGHAGLCTALFWNNFCTANLSLERIATTVQATILVFVLLKGHGLLNMDAKLLAPYPLRKV
ncbi:hypothetical protein ACQ4PT_042478 [Festuca glaucescens]